MVRIAHGPTSDAPPLTVANTSGSARTCSTVFPTPSRRIRTTPTTSACSRRPRQLHVRPEYVPHSSVSGGPGRRQGGGPAAPARPSDHGRTSRNASPCRASRRARGVPSRRVRVEPSGEVPRRRGPVGAAATTVLHRPSDRRESRARRVRSPGGHQVSSTKASDAAAAVSERRRDSDGRAPGARVRGKRPVNGAGFVRGRR